MIQGGSLGFGFLDPSAVVHDPHLSVFTRPEKISIGAFSRLDALIKLDGGEGLEIHEYVHVASFSHLNVGGGRLIFESHSGCSSGAKICSGMPDLSQWLISAAEPAGFTYPKRSLTVVGKYVVIFANAVVLPGVRIGDGAVVAAGAVVVKDVPPWTIVAGVPARKIGDRKPIS